MSNDIATRARYPEESYPEQRLSGLAISAAYAVHRAFAFGFLESVYRKALIVELRHQGAEVRAEVPYDLRYRGVGVGAYRADMIVEGRLVVEVKAGLLPDPIAPVQLLNYLTASRLEVGLVLHFGPDLQIRRLARSETKVSKSRDQSPPR